jgi:hypothetical protein
MHADKLIFGALFLGVVFAFLFMPTFGTAIQVCVLGNPAVVAEGMAGAVGYLSTCDEQVERLMSGYNMPLLIIFLGLIIPGAWLVFTGLQSRSLIGMRKEA